MEEEIIELPDLVTEEDTLVSLESVAVDIEDFLGQVRSCGGISLGMAQKASHLLPADTNYAYYSQTPTKTNLKATLESIDLKTALLIAGAVVAVAALAAKVFQYIKKSREKIQFTIKKLDGHVEAIDRCFKVCDKITSNMNAEAKAKVDLIVKELTDTYQTQISNHYNSFMIDILSNGKVSHALANGHKPAKELYDKVEKSVLLLEKLVYGNATEVDRNLLIDPTDLSLPDSLSVIYKSSSDRAGTATAEISESLKAMKDVKVKFTMDLEDFFDKNRKYTGSDSKVYGKGFPETTFLEKKVEKIEAQVAKKKDLDAELRQQINLVSHSLRSGLQQLMAFTSMCSMASSSSRQFWFMVEKYSATKLKRVAALALQDDDPQVKDALLQASKIKI